MAPSTGPVYLLAFDHRGSFQKKLLGIPGAPTPDDVARIRQAKAIIFAGFQEAMAGGLLPAGSGILVDEEFGADVAREAHDLRVVLAMPVERSGQDEFDFEYGEDFGAHIEAFDPTFAKVLVRYNPDGDAAMNRRQAERLARLGDWLHGRGRAYLFELLVPAEAAQLASVGGDSERYDRELRAGLMVRTIEELQASGVEPDIWKIEGLDARDDCVRVAGAARAGGRDGVACIVLGRGGDAAKVEGWLRTAAGVPGFVGFAVGRTIWWDALAAWLAGGDEAAASRAIAQAYRELITAYTDAAA
jgi:myo-inositol catabolism protein IolC